MRSPGFTPQELLTTHGARAHLSELMDRAYLIGETHTIGTRRSPRAAVVSLEDLALAQVVKTHPQLGPMARRLARSQGLFPRE